VNQFAQAWRVVFSMESPALFLLSVLFFAVRNVVSLAPVTGRAWPVRSRSKYEI
jgi:hypothetical protein